MGDIAPSKVPKLIKKRDGNEPVKVFKQGGKVKKFGLGGSTFAKIVDPVGSFVLPKSITENQFYDPIGNALGMDTAANKKNKEDSADQPGTISGMISQSAQNGKLLNKSGMKSGGKVNEAGNYTKPGLRKRIFNSIKAAAVQGTGAGKWSARKAQLMAKRYKAAGGGYRD
jgi:hypothetical protein